MTYIENVFVCIAAPLLLSTIFIEKEYRTLIFFTVVGMGSCLLSAYINSFFAGIYKTDYINATTQIATPPTLLPPNIRTKCGKDKDGDCNYNRWIYHI